ncbi:MAG: sugar transferase [Candidatus Margulisiibacteriota bacterium]
MKIFFDFLSAIILVVLFLPIFIVITVLIKLTSKGPVIFKQKRIGQNNKIFYMFKFRTMDINTPQNVPTHLLENTDTYITPIGKILRKTSLDELPQLINIIKGEMSFVGPRPALYNQDNLIELREIAGINSLKPGITGWAQINGRDELDIKTKVQYDEFYFKNKSLLFDIKIISRTLINVIFAKGIIEGKKKDNIYNYAKKRDIN